MEVGRYWLFALFCVAIAAGIVRLIARERVTVQASLFYLLALAALTFFALFPNAAAWLSTRMGFTLVSNWFFALSIAALSFLHLTALISLSRVERRSIALTQELALLTERVDQNLRSPPSPKS